MFMITSDRLAPHHDSCIVYQTVQSFSFNIRHFVLRVAEHVIFIGQMNNLQIFRSLIREDMWPKYPRLLAMFHKELDQAKVIFDKQMEYGKENDGEFPSYSVYFARTKGQSA